MTRQPIDNRRSGDGRKDTLDREGLRERYREERDKRLRQDGNEQYIETSGEFGHFVDDPYVEPGFVRETLHDHVDVAIVGGGFSGLLAGARLAQAGVGRIRIVESGGDFGGTWYWNRYPGAQCDIESYIYLPLLEELGYVPSEKYAHGPEIWAHTQAIGRAFGLYDDACLQTQVTALRWHELEGHWIVETNRGDEFTAQFVITAIGPLNRPKLPGIPGIETFSGHAFHTSRWDYDYTGGDTTGGLVNLSDKRVGIIGTGATAVQCIPHLGDHARELFVFQRTPSSVDKRGNQPTDPEWAQSLEPGWQQHRIENFGTLVSGGYAEVDLVSDGWTDIIRNLTSLGTSGLADLSPEEIAERLELADFHKMDQIRSRVDEIVEDRATAEALKPYYRQFCKRPCFHDDYLPTFNKANVMLVDTHGAGVQRITPRGVVVGGLEYELDCLIYATGFEVGTDYSRRALCEIHGRDGLKLSVKWADAVSTFHGLLSRGFPNCFLMGGLQSGVSPNFTELYNEQSQHIAYIVDRLRRRGHAVVEASEKGEATWGTRVLATASRRNDFAESCTPGYYNNEGRPGEGPGWFGGNFAGTAQSFFEVLRNWRADDALDGLEMR